MAFSFTRKDGNRIIQIEWENPFSTISVDGLIALPTNKYQMPATALQVLPPPEAVILQTKQQVLGMAYDLFVQAAAQPCTFTIDVFARDPGGSYLAALKRTWPGIPHPYCPDVPWYEYIQAYVLSGKIMEWVADLRMQPLARNLISHVGHTAHDLIMDMDEALPTEVANCQSYYIYRENGQKGVYRVYMDVQCGFWRGTVWVPKPNLYEILELRAHRVIRVRRGVAVRYFAMPENVEWQISHPLGSTLADAPRFMDELPATLLAFQEVAPQSE